MRRASFSLVIAIVARAASAFADDRVNEHGTPGSPRDAAASLSWQAPPPCPDAATVRRTIARWLGQESAHADLGPIRVVAVVRRQPAGWALDLTLVSPSGEARETLLAARCETLVKVVALKVALAVDPTAFVDFVQEPGSTPKAPEQKEVAPVVPGWGIRLAGGAAFGPLPGVAPAVSLVGSVRLHGVRFELGSNYRFARTTRYEALPSVGGRFDLLSATARICPTAVLGKLQVPLCAGLEAGALRGTGFGVLEATTSTEPWVAVLFGPALVLPLFDSVDLWVEVDAMLGLWRPGFRMRNLGRLYRPESGSAQGWAGLELRFD